MRRCIFQSAAPLVKKSLRGWTRPTSSAYLTTAASGADSNRCPSTSALLCGPTRQTVRYQSTFGSYFAEEDAGVDDQKKKQKIHVPKVDSEELLEMLKLYKRQFRDLYIKALYRVPASAPWPEKYHGYPLGLLIQRVRKAWAVERPPIEMVKQLDAIGFIWEPRKYRDDRLLAALNRYKELHDNLNVSKDFVVPFEDSNWPRELWDYKLGATCHSIRAHNDFFHLRPTLTRMGFLYKRIATSQSAFLSILQSLQVYRSKHKLSYVEDSFVIPADDSDYPVSMRGTPLGKIFQDMVYKGDYEYHHDDVKKLGYCLDGNELQRYFLFKEAVLFYKQEAFPTEDSWLALSNKDRRYGFRIPFSFVVPAQSAHYPVHLWGYTLGEHYNSVVHASAFAAHRVELEKMGLSLKQRNEERFVQILEAARCYRTLHPTAKTVPKHYIVPMDSPDFPPEVWGMKLGSIMKNIRCLGHFRQHHEDLAEMGFAVSPVPPPTAKKEEQAMLNTESPERDAEEVVMDKKL